MEARSEDLNSHSYSCRRESPWGSTMLQDEPRRDRSTWREAAPVRRLPAKGSEYPLMQGHILDPRPAGPSGRRRRPKDYAELYLYKRYSPERQRACPQNRSTTDDSVDFRWHSLLDLSSLVSLCLCSSGLC